MKKTASKTSKKTESIKKQNLDVNADAVKIQRTVNDHEVFYFYEDFGKPTGEIAKNLSEFLEKVKSAKAESLMFHQNRGDFQNWIEKTIGDAKLARRLAKIASSKGEDVRTKICRTVENRLKEFAKSADAVLVDANLALLQTSV